jgi:hypothetical protein
MTLVKGFELFGSRFHFRQLGDPLPEMPQLRAPAHVLAERFAHKLRTRSVFGLSRAFDFVRHLRRKGNRKSGCCATHSQAIYITC